MAAERLYDILAFGDPVADIMLRATELPPAGGKTVGQSLGIWPGGTTANMACAAARLSSRTALYGRTGDDIHAAMLRDSLIEHGVSTTWLRTHDNSNSASAIAVLMPSGEKSIVYMPMPPMDLAGGSLAQAMSQARMVYAMPYDMDELRHLHALARAAGTRIAVDLEAAVAPDWEQMQQRVALADIVFFNESGWRAATGTAPTPQGLRDVLALGPAEVIVTLGAAGAVAMSHDACAQHPAFATPVIDTTGAGDCFNAAYLSARLAGLSLPQALRLACAAASCAVAAVGARAGLPDQRKVAQVLATMPAGELTA